MEREGTSGTQRVGEQVRSRRRALGLSQMDIAARAGVHVVDVGLVERDERVPGAETARRLATALGAGPDVPDAGPPEPPPAAAR